VALGTRKSGWLIQPNAITILPDELSPSKWSEPLRVDNELSNFNSWREIYEKDEAALRPCIQDIGNWKSIKMVLSLSFVHDLEEMKSIIAKSYSGFAELKSYTKYWIEKFILNNTNYKNLCV